MLLDEEGIDPAAIHAATDKERGKIIAKMFAQRDSLRQAILECLTEGSRKRQTAMKLIRNVENIKDRILNPASHAGVTPIYTKEAEDAVTVIQHLEIALQVALATL